MGNKAHHVGKRWRIYFTSDVHGYLFPVDYATGEQKNSGLLSLIHEYKKDGDTLIIDAGDILQGSPFSTYIKNEKIGPGCMARVLNYGGYDYVVPGNHDFNYGADYLREYLNALNAKALCANIDGDLPITPYTVHTLTNGIKIGIVGIITDHVKVWEKPEHLEGLTINEPFNAAKKALEAIKNEADITVCIYHGGFERNINTDELLTDTTEHIGAKISRELDFDLLLTGHQHMPIEGQMYHGTYIVQPRENTVHYLHISCEITEAGPVFASRFKTPDGTFDETNTAFLQPIEDAVQKWLDKPVGKLAAPLPVNNWVTMALEGSVLADFFNQVQITSTDAQLSCASIANRLPGFNEDVTLRDIVANCPYSDVLVVLEVTGLILRSALERAASYLDIDENGTPCVASRFLLPKVEHYNYDYFYGLTYSADLTRPVGQRVMDMVYQGYHIKDNDVFTLCMSSYRATGTGGYDFYKNCPVLYRGQQETSEIITQYIQENGAVAVKRNPAPHFIY